LLEKRPDWGDRPASLRLILRPLTDASAARIAENLLGTTGLPPDIVKRIVEAAKGNPLYIEQILSMLVDTKALRQENGRWTRDESHGEIAIPPTIKALLEARLGQLGREERTAIEPASVIGLQFAAPAVASLAPEEIRADIGRHLDALARKQFVLPAPSADAESIYRFHHHLVRDTVYGGLLKRARAVLHVDFVRWADQVNAERGRELEFEEILGYHLEQAHRYLSELGPLDTKGLETGRDGSRRLASAARRSFSRGDLHAARSLFARATALLADDDPARLPLLPETGEVLVELGEYAMRARSPTRPMRGPTASRTLACRRPPCWSGCSSRFTLAKPAAGPRCSPSLSTRRCRRSSARVRTARSPKPGASSRWSIKSRDGSVRQAR
jgi:predicted ATPase